MFGKIMVPLDGSERAEQALPYAQHVASTDGGTVHLVYVVEPPSAVRWHGVGAPVNVYAPIIAAQREEAMAYLERTRRRLEQEGLAAQVALLDGDEASALLDYAHQAGIDLVVLTTHGRAGLTRWALGSVADRVAHGSTVPVLLMPVEGTSQASLV
jgi:nucleotide-binding universal stress UspA family protein